MMQQIISKNKATRNTSGTQNSATKYPDPLRAPPPPDETFLQAQPWPNEPRGPSCSSVKRPRHIKPGNLFSTEHNRSEMGLTIGCLENRTDCTALISRKLDYAYQISI